MQFNLKDFQISDGTLLSDLSEERLQEERVRTQVFLDRIQKIAPEIQLHVEDVQDNGQWLAQAMSQLEELDGKVQGLTMALRSWRA